MYQKFKQLIQHSFIYMVGTILTGIVSFVLIPIYTRVFSTTDYGILDVVLITAKVVISLSVLGLYAGLSMFYFHEKNEEEKKTMVSSNFIFLLSVTVILCLITIFFSKEIANIFLKNSAYGIYLILAVATVPFTTIISFCSTLYRLSFQPVKYFYIILGNLLFGTVLSIYLVVFKEMGLFGVLYGSLISSIIFSFWGLYLTKNQFNWNFSLQKIKDLLKFGLPLAPTGLMVWVIDSSNRYFLSYFRNVSDVGLYSVGFKFAAILLLVTSAFRLANAPFQYSISRENRVKEIYAKTLTYYMFATLFLAVGISIFSKELVSLFTPLEYLNGYQVIAPLAFSFLVFGIYQIAGIGLMLCKKTYYVTYSLGIASLASVLLNFFLIPYFGIVGAAFANLLAYLIGLSLIHFWNQKYYHIDFEIKRIVKILLFSVGLILFGLFLIPPSTLFGLLIKFVLILFFALGVYFSLELSEKDRLKLLINDISHKLSFKKSND